MNISLGNFREWLPFVFIIGGGALVLIAQFMKPVSQRSKKTMQLLANFKASLHEHDIEHWKEIFHGTREGALAPAGHFMNRIGKPVPLVSMWVTGSDEHSAIQRMAESMEIVCADILAHTVEVEIIWSEIGQLMEAMHDWLQDIPGVQEDATFLDEQYPFLKQVFDKYANRFKKWPCRSYSQR